MLSSAELRLEALKLACNLDKSNYPDIATILVAAQKFCNFLFMKRPTEET